MKKTLRVISVLLLVILLITISTNVFAAELTPSSVGSKITYGDDGGLADRAGKIMGMIRNVSVIASIIIIMILGVKYMLGSVEEKADYKKSFIPLIVGIVLVVSATSIASFIFNMAK